MTETRLPSHIKVLRQFSDVEPFLSFVREASDSNKKALGFVRSGIFAANAKRERLFVAVDSSRSEYLGHLLFDLNYPRASILQLYVSPSARRLRIASSLLAELHSDLEAAGYLSIQARVAEDLVESNNFWQRAGYGVSRRVLGGETTGRKILVRVFELDTPQLFPTSGVTGDSTSGFGLPSIERQVTPLYLIDLNVVFDIAKQRVYHDEAVALFKLAHLGEFRPAISDEAGRELDRSGNPGHPDAMRGLIEAIPRVALPKATSTDQLIAELAGLIFPYKKYPSELKRNDLSDCRHVATAITHRAAGFVTRDGSIAKAAEKILQDYGLNILSAEEFTRPVWADGVSYNLDVNRSIDFSIDSMRPEDSAAARKFLTHCGVSSSEVDLEWIPSVQGGVLGVRAVAKVQEAIVGFCAWSITDRFGRSAVLRMAIDEASANSNVLADALLTLAVSQLCQTESRSLCLMMPARQLVLKEAALEFGFRANSSGQLRKILRNGIVTSSSWGEFRQAIESTECLKLPAAISSWDHFFDVRPVIDPAGQRRFLSSRDIETLMSPVLLAAPGTPGVVVPIRKKYLERLLGHPRQLTLGPKLQAEVSRQRVYLADPKTLKRFRKGALIYFYETGGKRQGGVVAVARIVEAFLIRRDSVSISSLANSVLTLETLSEIGSAESKAACVFESPQWLPQPVALDDLRLLGFKNGQLISAISLSGDQSDSILSMGGAG